MSVQRAIFSAFDVADIRIVMGGAGGAEDMETDGCVSRVTAVCDDGQSEKSSVVMGSDGCSPSREWVLALNRCRG